MKRRDIAIVGYYETKFERRSGRSVYDIAGEAAVGALAHAGISKDEVDGVAVNTSLSGAAEPFWSNRICDALGLVPRWLQTTDIGGSSSIGNVARAAAMIRDGWCRTVLVLAADAPSTTWQARYGSYRQLRGAATGRQVPNPRNAMVTGIGVVPFIRNWGSSAVMVLEV